MNKNTKTDRPLLVLLDAHALIHRAYHALPDFTNSKGEPTGAVYGFLTMILKLMEDMSPTYVAACYDLPGGTFRHEAYKEYKGGRGKIDDALIVQLQSSRLACEAFNIPIYDAPGFEADDVLGTIAAQLKDIACDVIIASGDMDTLQLVDGDRVKVFTLRKGIKDTVMYNEEAVRERFGFAPLALPDYKGLRGDASDNIIGIPGIGEKTAEILLRTYGSLDLLYVDLEADPKTVRTKTGLSERIVNLLADHKEEALFSRILATIRTDAPVVYTMPELPWKESLDTSRIQSFCLDNDFKSLWMRMEKLLSSRAENSEEITLASQIPEQVLTPAQERELGVGIWLLDSEKTHPDMETIFQITGTRDFEKSRTWIREQLTKQDLLEVYEHIELPLIPIVERMREDGIMIDIERLGELSKDYQTQCNDLEKQIREYAGVEFNVRSSKQLGEVLFDTLGLGGKKLKKTATGMRTTKESELEKMRDDHPIIPLILKYREMHKLLSTYVDALPLLADASGRIHPELLQDGTSTGRFSCQNPNVQNIPIRNEEGRKLREVFIAAPGKVFIVADYSQIELRIAAMLSGDETLIDVFRSDRDIHREVAARVFDVASEEVTHDMRHKAKTINFGILYGMGVNALQVNLGSTRAEAQQFLSTYMTTFPKIEEYMRTTVEYVAKHGYTVTRFGRRRWFPQIHSRIPYIRAGAERMAINAPIQGTQADCIKLAMIAFDSALEKAGARDHTKMLLQIHDELIIETDTERVDEIIPLLTTCMQSAFEDSWLHIIPEVPIRVSVATGRTWGLAKA